jgi:hypothetical protein
MKRAILFTLFSILSIITIEAKAASCWEIISTPNISVLGNVVLNPTPISCTTTPSGKAWLQVTTSYNPPPPTDLFLLINLSDPHMSGLTFSPLLVFNGFNSSNVPIVSTDIITGSGSSTMTATILPPSGVDVWVEDTPHNYLGTPDSGDEPDSNMASQAMWKSRAIWNRKTPGTCNATHDNPEFGQENFLCIRVKNKGSSTALNTTVKAYWANPSTGLAWSDPSIGQSQWTEISSSPKTISSITSGGDEIVEMSWFPPNPTNNVPDTGHFCLVARIDNADDPLTGEGTDINYNTRHKNNIAWRNVNVVNLIAKTAITHDFTIHQLSETRVTQIRFNFTNGKGETVTPPKGLTQITIGGLNNLKFDKKAMAGFKLTETREGGISAQMTENNASFDVVMAKGEEHALQLIFAPTTLKELSENISFNIEQFEEGKRVGGISYSLNIKKVTEDVGQKTQEGTSNHINYFTLTLSSALTSDASVDYQTRDGTAIAGEDYTETKGTVIISAGETTALIGVEILADNITEDDESFSLVLTNPRNGLFPQGKVN